MKTLDEMTIEQKKAHQKSVKEQWYEINKDRINKNRAAEYAKNKKNKPKAEPNPSHLKTVKEYAELCGLKVASIKDRIFRGIIAYEKGTHLIDVENYTPKRLTPGPAKGTKYNKN